MGSSLRPVADYRHDYTAANGFPASARVRVFEPDRAESEASPAAVVILTDLGEGPSVTNNVEQLAGEVAMRFALPRDPSRTAFVEHYLEGRYGGQDDPETFDLVTFDRWYPEQVLRGGRWILQLGTPDWRRVERQAVEDLVDRRLDD